MQINLFEEEMQLEKQTKLGDSLERLNVIDFESFRPLLKKSLAKERKNNASRPPFDCVMMFKILVLQRLFNLSDDQTEFQITDRMSFQRFFGLSLGERIPDAKTLWLFKDTLSLAGTIELLFDEFNRQLEASGIITHKAQKDTDARWTIKGGETHSEHVFGFMTGAMHGITVRSIGIRRADFNIGLTNLVYNFCRYSIIKRKAVSMG